MHVYAGTGERRSYAPGTTGRTVLHVGCVTTVADAGSAGWREFNDFAKTVIDRSKTRVLVACLNIVGHGMRGGNTERRSPPTWRAAPRGGEWALRSTRLLVVGIKTAPYAGPEWIPVEHAVEAAQQQGQDSGDGGFSVEDAAGAPISPHPRNCARRYLHALLFRTAPRTGWENGKLNIGICDRGPKTRRDLVDVGHGGGSFVAIAVPAMKQGLFRIQSRPTCIPAARTRA